MHRLFASFVLFVAMSAVASQPGQPIDCSDWVAVTPGHSCVVWSESCGVESCANAYAPGVLTADRTILVWRREELGPCEFVPSQPKLRWHLESIDNGTRSEIGYFEHRCFAGGTDGVSIPGLLFDLIGGAAIFPIQRYCTGPDGQSEGCYTDISSHFAIDGFTALADIVQSFEPGEPSSPVVFSVPPLPEGLPAADHFDTYWGVVKQPLDLANAQPLQCAYPSSPPSAGDDVRITAPVPTPPPGSANFVLTSVTYRGQTHAGRKASGGRMYGRDASRLPACSAPPALPKRR